MSEYIFAPIGHIRSMNEKKYEAPRQPETGHDKRVATIELYSARNFEQALADLRGFERIWIVYVFDRNRQWKPKVLVPRGRTKRGVFATRAPYRPKPIGMSNVRLIDIQGLIITIADCDILDGTPILDIKPYIPAIDSFPNSKAGWVDSLSLLPQYSIKEEEEVKETLDQLTEEDTLLRSTIYDILLNDPFPHPYRRIKNIDTNNYVLAVQLWRIHYTIEDTLIMLKKINR